MAGRVNLLQLRREISAQEAKAIAPRMREIMNEKFDKEKQRLLRKFDNDPITKELAGGPSASSSVVKEGNLYSFLGFVNGVNPVEELRNALDQGITKGRVKKAAGRGSTLRYNLEVRIPAMEEIKRRTKLLKWIDRSFIDYIENGLENLKRYVFEEGRFKTSRSGTAIQYKGDIPGRKGLKGRKYITKMIEDFTNRLKNFNKR